MDFFTTARTQVSAPVSTDKAAPSQARRFPPMPIRDSGKVRLGGQGPLFRATIADAGKVRLGGQGPCFRAAAIADAGKVRIGGQGPIFR